jgi:hypothetical protein
MPLDALSGTLTANPLAVLLERRGIEPVNWNTLDAHKQTQCRRFGPTFWYRHRQLLGLALIGSIGLMAFTAGAANALMPPPSPIPLWISMAWMCVVAALTVSGVVRVRAGSHWEERWLPVDLLESSGVPEPIAAMARAMHCELPGSTFILGELVQEAPVLDPYLLLVWNEERVCLGIWDDTGIIASAR